MRDYADLLDRILRGLGKAFTASAETFNTPGRSLAVKIDPLYYLAVWPSFSVHVGRLAAMLPRTVEEVLVRTGNLVSHPPERRVILPLRLTWPGGEGAVNAAFLLAVFVERGLTLYAGAPGPLPVSAVRIRGADRPAVLDFFADKTPPHSTAFDPAT